MPQAAHSAIDRAHLQRQTMGDAGLAAEILSLFLDQVPHYRRALSEAASEPKRLGAVAHRVAGASLAVGAVALADAARHAEAEALQDRAVPVGALLAALAEAEAEARRIIAGESR